jgi:opacity protein-like surface antigen
MIKRVILNVLAVTFCFSSIAAADDYFSVGIHLGLQHDVGNLDSYDSSIQSDPQNNYFLGISFKTNFSFIFARFGADTTFLINRGKVYESSGNEKIEYSKIHYVSLPFFLGYNFKVQDVGNFYMGPGLSYFIARGTVTTSTGISEDINASGWGYGFIAGIEYKLSSKLDFYFEWEYLNGRSGPVVGTQSGYTWENFYVDFTGHRFVLGIRYYLI